jgi:hypothetical protein
MVKASCYKLFVWLWCFDWCNVVGVIWILDVVVPGVWKVVCREDVCVVGVIDVKVGDLKVRLAQVSVASP